MKKFYIILLLLSTTLLGQADGTFDPSFGTNGQVRTCSNNPLFTQRILIQNDDKIILGGFETQAANPNFLLARYTIDGNLDNSFGNQGIVITNLGRSDIFALALQPDNKIIAAGRSGILVSNGTLARYNPNGSLDTTFGNSGIVVDTSIPGFIFDLAVQPDGKIIAVSSRTTAFNSEGRIVRYNTNGTKDTSFNGTGVVVLADNIGLRAVNIQNDGKIVVVGTINEAGTNRLYIARYLTTGVLDTSFSGDGFDTQLVGTNTTGRDVVVLDNGNILALAQSTSGVNQDASLFLYNNDGTLNVAFGTSGIETFNLGSNSDSPDRLAIQTDSKILIVGGTSSVRLARRLANGDPDGSFGPNSSGLITHTVLGNFISGNLDIAINSKGNIIVTSTANNCLALTQYEVNSLRYSILSRALWQTYYNQNIRVKNSDNPCH